ncbi:PilW family protein [Ferrimonas senticii]|uniref:PilW family protein n=1 Tax=Ferrimonas senticii TaxID=394566 RepID=UPI0004873FE8|nr:PilW family protein [Ferrimonas senticii]
MILRRQRGLTLIELMIALMLSLMIMGLVFTSVLADGATYEASRSSNQLIHKSRMSLHSMRLYLQQAGYREFDQIVTDQQVPNHQNNSVAGINFDWDDGQIIQAIDNTAAAGILAGSDVIAIRFFGSDPANGEVYRCDGSTLAAGVIDTMVFYLSAAEELFCEDGTGAHRFEQGIEQMQLDFAPNRDGIYRYQTANDVADWSQIGHLRLALLVSREMSRAPIAANQTYDVLGTAVTKDSDGEGKVRQVVRDNINLLNNRGV